MKTKTKTKGKLKELHIGVDICLTDVVGSLSDKQFKALRGRIDQAVEAECLKFAHEIGETNLIMEWTDV